jgi:hypothetical protein
VKDEGVTAITKMKEELKEMQEAKKLKELVEQKRKDVIFSKIIILCICHFD